MASIQNHYKIESDSGLLSLCGHLGILGFEEIQYQKYTANLVWRPTAPVRWYDLSASLATQGYFPAAPVLCIPGQIQDVEVNYLAKPERDYLKAAIQAVIQIHSSEPPGA
eukprot:5077738-Amphidinium_carterae.1